MVDVNPIYLAVFIIYLFIVLGIGMWGYLRTETLEDFWVYGKELGPWLATWSYVANFVSAVTIIGFIGTVYGDGYSILTGIILGLILGVCVLYFFVHKIREFDHITFPDIITELTGYEMARPIAGLVLFMNAWVYLVMQLVGAGLLVTLVTGVPYEYMVWVIGGVFIIYTVLGGLVSVAWTDLLQGTLMVAMIAVALVWLIFDLGGIVQINQQFAALDSGNVAPLGEGTYTLIGLLGSLLAFFGSVFTSQHVFIRINATKDIRTAKFFLAASGVILSVFYVLLILLGGATTVALNDAGLSVDNVDNAYPTLLTQYMPTELGIVLILAVLSGILSTTDTRLHSCGVTMSRDIYDYFVGGASDETLWRVSRISTVVFGILATAFAVDPPGTIVELYEWRAVLLTSAFLVPVYLTLYVRGIAGKAVLVSIVSGAILGVGWDFIGQVIDISSLFAIPGTFIGVGAAFVSLIIGHLLWRETSEPILAGGD